MKNALSAASWGFDHLLGFALVACLGTMTVLVFGNVVLRYGFNSGIVISEEISRYVFVWMTFFGAVVGMRERAHLGVDTLVQRVPRWGKRLFLAVSELLMLGCCGLFLVGSWQQTIINLDNHAPVSGVSLAWVYGIGVFASACMALSILRSLFRLFTGRLSDEELVQVKDSEEEVAVESEAAIGGNQA